MPSSQDLSFAKAKLASSGISLEDAVALGMSVVRADNLDQAFKPVRALHIPYHDVDGRYSEFFRIRYLEDMPGFGAQLAKPQRYAQRAGTLNWVYLPRLPLIDWEKVSADATEPLLITEGELKAACACLHGFSTIALGGVSVWQSRKKGVPLLPPLDKFNWKGRSVVVVFDSDAATNPNVAQASTRLCKELLRLGAAPRVASLPPAIDGGKQGLDDFLVAGRELSDVLQETKSLDLGDYLLDFNKKFAYVPKMDVVVNLVDGHLSKRDAFTNGVCANVKVVEFTTSASGNPRREDIAVAKHWLEWTARREVQGITYRPGGARVTEDGWFNGWRAWGVEPSPGDVGPWHELLQFAFRDEPEHRAWFEQWAAYPLQHPGTKLHTAVVMWSPGQGVGKSLIGNTLGKIYGENFTALNSALLRGDFNGWFQNRQFILGDEVVGTDKRGEADRLKSIITQDTAWINSKGIPEFEVPDYCNWFMTSNHSNAFFMDHQDRRFAIIRLPSEPLDKEFYDRFIKWRDCEGGAEALFDYLLKLKLDGFNPTAQAPLTKSKAEMIEHGMSDVACFVQHFLRNLDDELARFAEFIGLKETPDMVLSRDLLRFYDSDQPNGRSSVTAGGITRELTKFMIDRLPLVRTTALGSVRLTVLRNKAKWFSAKDVEVRDYVDRVYFRPTMKAKF